MDPSTIEDILIRLDSIDQLFNDPDLNPFSDKEVNLTGQAGLVYAVRTLLAKRWLRWKPVRFVIQLPAGEVTPELESELTPAVQRFIAAKIADNLLTIRLSRTRSLLGLGMVTIIAIVLLGLIALLFTTLLSSLDETVMGLIAGFTSVIIWVMLWAPMEALLFEWISPALENRILRKLKLVEFRLEALASQEA